MCPCNVMYMCLYTGAQSKCHKNADNIFGNNESNSIDKNY